jgi:DNA-directed RNA polymerase subunit RPC12/RpoP
VSSDKRKKACVPPAKQLGLQCPKCGCRHLVGDRNLESKRIQDVEDGVRRTRYCRHCGHAVVTQERIV